MKQVWICQKKSSRVLTYVSDRWEKEIQGKQLRKVMASAVPMLPTPRSFSVYTHETRGISWNSVHFLFGIFSTPCLSSDGQHIVKHCLRSSVSTTPFQVLLPVKHFRHVKPVSYPAEQTCHLHILFDPAFQQTCSFLGAFNPVRIPLQSEFLRMDWSTRTINYPLTPRVSGWIITTYVTYYNNFTWNRPLSNCCF